MGGNHEIHEIHEKGLHVDLETRRYAPEHEVLGNTQNTQKKALHVWEETTKYTKKAAAPQDCMCVPSVSSVPSVPLSLCPFVRLLENLKHLRCAGFVLRASMRAASVAL